jgi:hypothetical protein
LRRSRHQLTSGFGSVGSRNDRQRGGIHAARLRTSPGRDPLSLGLATSAVNPRHYRAERPKLTKGQKPYAIIFSCADSRVPPEIVFDESLGRLFVIRVPSPPPPARIDGDRNLCRW